MSSPVDLFARIVDHRVHSISTNPWLLLAGAAGDSVRRVVADRIGHALLGTVLEQLPDDPATLRTLIALTPTPDVAISALLASTDGAPPVLAAIYDDEGDARAAARACIASSRDTSLALWLVRYRITAADPVAFITPGAAGESLGGM